MKIKTSAITAVFAIMAAASCISGTYTGEADDLSDMVQIEEDNIQDETDAENDEMEESDILGDMIVIGGSEEKEETDEDGEEEYIAEFVDFGMIRDTEYPSQKEKTPQPAHITKTKDVSTTVRKTKKEHRREVTADSEVKIPLKIKKICRLTECAILNMHENKIKFNKGNRFAWTVLSYYANNHNTKTDKDGNPILGTSEVEKYYKILTGKKPGKIRGAVGNFVRKKKNHYIFCGSDRGTAIKTTDIAKTKKGYRVQFAAITYPVRDKKDIYEADIRNGKIFTIKKIKNS